jgi:dUTP pyrophosphatase
MKIKIKYSNPICKIESFGDWIDLRAEKEVTLQGPKVNSDNSILFNSAIIPLGVSMQLPKHFEANVLPRSSTYNKYGIISNNSQGVIDNTYCGDDDKWGFLATAFRATTIKEGERICQFRIRPTQTAPVWIKLKWLFTSKVKFVEVESLKNPNRGGFGSTGKK